MLFQVTSCHVISYKRDIIIDHNWADLVWSYLQCHTMLGLHCAKLRPANIHSVALSSHLIQFFTVFICTFSQINFQLSPYMEFGGLSLHSSLPLFPTLFRLSTVRRYFWIHTQRSIPQGVRREKERSGTQGVQHGKKWRSEVREIISKLHPRLDSRPCLVSLCVPLSSPASICLDVPFCLSGWSLFLAVSLSIFYVIARSFHRLSSLYPFISISVSLSASMTVFIFLACLSVAFVSLSLLFWILSSVSIISYQRSYILFSPLLLHS